MKVIHSSCWLLLAALILLPVRPAGAEMSDSPLERLIRQLGSTRFPDREAASRALDKLGAAALQDLRLAQESDDAEVRRRAAELVETIERRLTRQRQDRALDALKNLGCQIEMESVSPEPAVRRLSLTGDKITDEVLAYLAAFPRLVELDLSGSKITSRGLAQLKGLDNLRILVLNHTAVTDQGLVHLKKLKQLHSLFLSGTPLTNAGLQHLKEMTGLFHLDLSHTAVTNAGLESFKSCPRLTRVQLEGTRVTEDAVSQLRMALPRLKIQH